MHEAIARIVTRILNENHSVPGVSVPLNQNSASPSLAADPDVTENVKTSDTETSADSFVKKKIDNNDSKAERKTKAGLPTSPHPLPRQSVKEGVFPCSCHLLPWHIHANSSLWFTGIVEKPQGSATPFSALPKFNILR